MHLDVAKITKKFGSKVILEQISLQVEPGTIVGLLGANGTGKTTLLRILATIYAPTDGEVRFDGVPLQRDQLAQRRRLHLIPDNPRNLAMQTVLEYVANAAVLYGQTLPTIEAKILPILERWQLTPLVDQHVALLSRGQNYKLALAALELADPELWLLDEPFASGMDPIGLTQLKRSLFAARDRGRIILFSTQLVDLAGSIANRIAVLEGAHLHAIGSLVELRTMASQDATSKLAQLLGELQEKP